MNKNVLAVFTAVCGLFMISCDTPKDDRPGAKASVNTVPPGMRSTNNVSDEGDVMQPAHDRQVRQHDVMLNHDPGANTIQKGDSIPNAATTNEADSVNKR